MDYHVSSVTMICADVRAGEDFATFMRLKLPLNMLQHTTFMRPEGTAARVTGPIVQSLCC